MKVKTKQTFDVNRSLSIEPKERKILFQNLQVATLPSGDKNVSIDIYYIERENVPIEVTDIDENGNLITRTEYRDETVYWYTDSMVFPAQEYDAIYNAVKTYIPDGLTRSQEDEWIMKMGFLQALIAKGYGRGAFTSLDDFEIVE